MAIQSPQEARKMRALIVRSGKQMSGVIITKGAVEDMYKDRQSFLGSPLFDQVNFERGVPCGFLDHVDIVKAPDGELELWGWFSYVAAKPFGSDTFCSYSLTYDEKNYDPKSFVLSSCSLNACVMIKATDVENEFSSENEPVVQ